MLSILITAFEPYDIWTENSSWLTLVEYSKSLPSSVKIVTRRYPVNFQMVRERLARDLADNFDYAIHLGQAPGSAAIRLEAFGINVGGSSKDSHETLQPLISDGPSAYRSTLPLANWARMLRESGVPAGVSYHAGTYLCNAVLYLSHHFAKQQRLKTQTTFLHLPLDITQVCGSHKEMPALPTRLCADGLQLIVSDLATQGSAGLGPAASPSLA
jgi:pyroglutamyl-peptidase